MGTNFYAVPIPTKKEYDQTIKELSIILNNFQNKEHSELNRDIRELIIDLKEFLEDIDREYPEIHLGKRSAGWQFLWQYHGGDYYQDNLQSIKEFLSKPDIIIKDEYGDRFTVDEFFNDELDEWLYKDEHHYDLDSYYDEHPKEYRWRCDTQWTSDDGLRFETSDFC